VKKSKRTKLRKPRTLKELLLAPTPRAELRVPQLKLKIRKPPVLE
jgi:hypothetical protein